MDAEQPLAGGNMGPVSRRGDEVLRTAGPWTPNVHRLLQLCADSGIEEIPRPLGYTEDGRERLSYLPGTVPAYPMPEWVWTSEVLDDAAHLLRRLHDASLPLAAVPDGWRSPVRQPAEVVCHNDFAPYNLVFDDGRLVGVIDFDYCSPGPRLWDLAYLAYTARAADRSARRRSVHRERAGRPPAAPARRPTARTRPSTTSSPPSCAASRTSRTSATRRPSGWATPS